FHTTVHTMAINHSMVQQPPVKNKLKFIIKISATKFIA
ncbi:hypothetical protein HMPREF1018_04772, partial [Bacteroides fragilis]